jgi:RNA polymerase sigma-70 factor, ECF subfamily
MARFEQCVLPHLPAAYNLACWLLRDGHDAEDAVQDASLRAYEHVDDLCGGDGRAWLLAIVRNVCRTRLGQKREHLPTVALDPAIHTPAAADPAPDAALLQAASGELLRRALAELPEDFREAVVLRELEGLSYKEIAVVAGVPIGTVMSRLARARERLEQCLAQRADKEA